MAQRVLILNGSPKNKSTSAVFAEAFVKHYHAEGGQAEMMHIKTLIESPEELAKLGAALHSADCIGLFFPLYVDSLPSNLLSALHHIEKIMGQKNGRRAIKVFAVTQCGYPFTENMKHAINNCKYFAEAISATWIGGISYGGGVLINGTPLDQLGRKGQKLDKLFQDTATAIFKGELIPESVLKRVYQKKRPIVFRLLVPFLNYLLKKEDEAKGINRDVRPFQNIELSWD